MKTGDYVTGVPASPEMREDFPNVTGSLEISKTEFMGDEWEVFTVKAEYEDGSEAPVEVMEANILPASPRRVEKTTLPNPE